MSLLIALEGTDAAGKNTQSKLLADRLMRLGYESHLYSFPRYETELGKTIRRHLMGETALMVPPSIALGSNIRAPEDPLWFQCAMLANKMEAAEEIRRHLYRGHYVICDRWTPSAVVFGAADGLDAAWLTRVQSPLPAAYLYVLLMVTEEETLRRRPVLRDRYEKDREKQKVVRAGYEELWAEKQADNMEPSLWVTVDGNGPTVEAVHEKIWEHVITAQAIMRLRG